MFHVSSSCFSTVPRPSHFFPFLEFMRPMSCVSCTWKWKFKSLDFVFMNDFKSNYASTFASSRTVLAYDSLFQTCLSLNPKLGICVKTFLSQEVDVHSNFIHYETACHTQLLLLLEFPPLGSARSRQDENDFRQTNKIYIPKTRPRRLPSAHFLFPTFLAILLHLHISPVASPGCLISLPRPSGH